MRLTPRLGQAPQVTAAPRWTLLRHAPPQWAGEARTLGQGSPQPASQPTASKPAPARPIFGLLQPAPARPRSTAPTSPIGSFFQSHVWRVRAYHTVGSRAPNFDWMARQKPRESSPAPETATAYKRVPIEGRNGYWCGKRGDSVWNSTHPKVLRVTQGEGISFAAGYPNFAPWAVATLCFQVGVLQGTSGDAGQADSLWACGMGCEVGTAKKLRRVRGLVWHHVEDCQTMHLLPTLLHANIPHAGGAVLLRHARRATRSPCLQP